MRKQRDHEPTGAGPADPRRAGPSAPAGTHQGSGRQSPPGQHLDLGAETPSVHSVVETRTEYARGTVRLRLWQLFNLDVGLAEQGGHASGAAAVMVVALAVVTFLWAPEVALSPTASDGFRFALSVTTGGAVLSSGLGYLSRRTRRGHDDRSHKEG